MAVLTPKVELAFTTDPDNPSPSYTDVSAYCDLTAGIRITRGRTDQFSVVGPASVTLTLDNHDGRFTPERSSSPYYPNVKLARRLRISVTDGVTTWVRFDGRVVAWPVNWAPNAFTSAVTITAVDRSARFQGIELSNVIASEVGSNDPAAYYMMGDAAGSKVVVDSAPIIPESSGRVVGSVTFGSATGPGTDGITAASFASGAYVDCPLNIASGSSWSLSVFLLTSVGAALNDVPFLSLFDDAGGQAWMAVSGLGSGQLGALIPGAGFGAGSIINDGVTHHAALTYDTATNTGRVYLDGAFMTSAGGSDLAHISRLIIGSPPHDTGNTIDPFVGTLAHAAVFSTVLTAQQVADISASGFTAFVGESASARVARLARYAGVDPSEISVETGYSTLTALDTTGRKVLDLMRDAETAEPGVLLIGRNGAVNFQGRRHRWNLASTVTLGAGTYSADLQPLLDDFGITNDCTVTRGQDTTAYRSADAASIQANGWYTKALDLIVNTDAQTRDRAGWEVTVNGNPTTRWPQVSVDVMTQTSVRSGTFTLEVGSRLTLSGLPSTAKASTVDLVVEGYDEVISLTGHDITFNCSVYAPDGFLTLNDATLGKIDQNHLGL